MIFTKRFVKEMNANQPQQKIGINHIDKLKM